MMNKYIYAPGKTIWCSNTNKFLLTGKDGKKYWVGYYGYLSFLRKKDIPEAQEDWNKKIEATEEELKEIAIMEDKYA